MLQLDPSIRGATFSPCRQYRYELWRRWGRGSLVVIGLNPSTADEQHDDPTIRRCIGFAKRWEFGGLVMLNLFAWRSSDPFNLGGVAEPIGPDNDAMLLARCCDPASTMILAAWGAEKIARERGAHVVDVLTKAGVVFHCLGLTQAGCPRHPLYVPGNIHPRLYAIA